MDLLCDSLVEEILRRLPAKYLHRVRAASRRCNLIFLSPGFAARYWESQSSRLSGVFIQSSRPWRQRYRFLDGSSDPSSTESMFASDLAFLPRDRDGPVARSKEIFIVHATAGLLLCSRGEYNAVEYYVCNPVTLQWVALPKLPWLPAYLSGLLSVSNHRDDITGSIISRFQVVLFNHPRFWDDFSGGYLMLMVFSSATGTWQAKSIEPQIPVDVEAYAPPFLGLSGTAYWIGYTPMDKLVAYNSLNDTIQVLPVPARVHGSTLALNRCIGERHGGGLWYAHFDCSVFQVWDLPPHTDGDDDGVDGADWKLVHQVGVMELAEQNPQATAIVTKRRYVKCRVDANSLFSVLRFHPTQDDIIFLDVNGTIVAYSIQHGTTTYQCSHRYLHHDMFPYVHPAHPVEIPPIKKEPLKLKPS